MKQTFRTIEDNQVRLVWKCTAESCEYNNPISTFSPDHIEDNIPPVCDCGMDMEYQGIQVAIPTITIEVSGGVANVTKCPECVEVEIVDHDNENCGEE